MTKKADPPSTLGRRGCRLWRAAVAEHEFSPAEAVLLEALSSAYDVWGEATAALKKDGVVTLDRFGQARPHPAVNICRDAANTMAKLARQLTLELPDDAAAVVRHPHASRPGPKRVA
jgi:P27 family predicted phage terminase small subunit